MVSGGDFRKGLTIEIDGQVWVIVDFQHVKPGKGPAFVRTKLKNIKTGRVIDNTFSSLFKATTSLLSFNNAIITFLLSIILNSSCGKKQSHNDL